MGTRLDSLPILTIENCITKLNVGVEPTHSVRCTLVISSDASTIVKTESDVKNKSRCEANAGKGDNTPSGEMLKHFSTKLQFFIQLSHLTD